MEEKRVYLVTIRKPAENSIGCYSHVVGIFTNQKKALEGIGQVEDISQLYIVGARKNKQLTSVSLNVELQAPKVVDIYHQQTNKIIIQISQIHLNTVNPKFVLKNEDQD